MSRYNLPSLALATLVVAGCGGGGLNYWLYPAPRLAESEESLFLATEGDQLLTIDGAEAGSKCWRVGGTPQAYRRMDVMCHLHILPGQHLVVFHPGVSSREKVSLTFTSLPGKAYRLDWSSCANTSDGRQQTCMVNVVEVENPAEGG